MIHVCFDSTTAGSIHASSFPEEKNRKKRIICFEWMLDIGHLKEGLESRYRKELPGRLISHHTFGRNDKEGMPEIGDSNVRAWSWLKESLSEGESVTVWYGGAPGDLCGFYCLCTLLREYDSTVYIMNPPLVRKRESEYFFVKRWSFLDQESLGDYLSSRRMLEKDEILANALHWEKLIKEDVPLRAIISGLPVSVREDFYDPFIEAGIPGKPVRIAQAAYAFLCMGLGTNACLVTWRIQAMIDAGKLKVIEEPDDQFMHMTIQRC